MIACMGTAIFPKRRAIIIILHTWRPQLGRLGGHAIKKYIDKPFCLYVELGYLTFMKLPALFIGGSIDAQDCSLCVTFMINPYTDEVIAENFPKCILLLSKKVGISLIYIA